MLLVPTPYLKPEFVYTVDGGIAYYPTDKAVSFNLRFYHSSLRDYIGRMAYSIARQLTLLLDHYVSDEVVTTQPTPMNGRIMAFRKRMAH